MKKNKLFKYLSKILPLIVFFSIFTTNTLPTKAEDSELLHLVVLADISGSLDTEDTDNLQRLITRIPRYLDTEKLQGSKISVIAFASYSVQVCDTFTISEVELNNTAYVTCLEQIQSIKRANPNKDKRAEGVDIHTNQVKAFEKGLEITSLDPENFIPVFLLLTDGALDPTGSGWDSKEARDEFERGFIDVRPQMQDENVQLFIFGFGNAKLEDLTKWESFSAQRRACQEEAPERTYPSEGDIFPLLISINTAMDQVTCGESKPLITIEPGKPKVYYVSDLVERLNIKIDLKGTSGIEAEVTDPEGNLLSSNYEISSEGECIDAYIVCYEITDPMTGNWTLSSSLFSSEATTTSIIVADITLYGTFSVSTNCEINTFKNGFENCTFQLIPTRQDAKDLNKAIDSLSFDFVIDNFNVQERGSFFKDSLSIQLFRNLELGSGSLSIEIKPIYSELEFTEDFKWLQYIENDNADFVLEPLVTETTVIQEEPTEEIEVVEESEIPWLLIALLILLALILGYLTSRKRDLPSGTMSYGMKNSSNLSNLVIYGGAIKEYFEVSKSDSGIEVNEGDSSSVSLLTLESLDRKGLKFWDDKPAQNFQLKFEEQVEKSVDEVEIIIYDEYIVKFSPDESDDEFGSFDDDDEDDDFIDFE